MGATSETGGRTDCCTTSDARGSAKSARLAVVQRNSRCIIARADDLHEIQLKQPPVRPEQTDVAAGSPGMLHVRFFILAWRLFRVCLD